jgi:hypothetical protein
MAATSERCAEICGEAGLYVDINSAMVYLVSSDYGIPILGLLRR